MTAMKLQGLEKSKYTVSLAFVSFLTSWFDSSRCGWAVVFPSALSTRNNRSPPKYNRSFTQKLQEIQSHFTARLHLLFLTDDHYKNLRATFSLTMPSNSVYIYLANFSWAVLWWLVPATLNNVHDYKKYIW